MTLLISILLVFTETRPSVSALIVSLNQEDMNRFEEKVRELNKTAYLLVLLIFNYRKIILLSG